MNRNLYARLRFFNLIQFTLNSTMHRRQHINSLAKRSCPFQLARSAPKTKEEEILKHPIVSILLYKWVFVYCCECEFINVRNLTWNALVSSSTINGNGRCMGESEQNLKIKFNRFWRLTEWVKPSPHPALIATHNETFNCIRTRSQVRRHRLAVSPL